MERIKSLYSAFSKYEQRIFKTYLSAFHNKGENKALQLVDLIEKNPEVTLENASKKLYNDGKSKAFLMMKARVFEKMTEFLSLSISVSAVDKEEKDPLNVALLEYRKSMLFAHSLRMRGRKDLALDFLEKALTIAKEMSCPELEMDPLLRFKAIRARRPEPDEKNELFIEMSDVLGRLETDLNAIAIYHHLLEQFNLKTGHEDQRLKYLEDNIPQLEEMIQKKYSVRAEYYLMNMKVLLFGPRRMYPEAKAAILRLIELVNHNIGLQNRERMSTPHLHLGLLEANEGNYEQALVSLDKALELSSDLPRARINIQTYRIYILVYIGRLKEATEVLDELKNPEGEFAKMLNPESEALLQYLEACISYFEGNVKRAWQKMQNIEELNFDKAGWNTGYRIFDILLLIELNETDFAAMKLENLRKHISKYDIDQRSKAIFKVLTAMEKNGFSFEKIANEEQLLSELNEAKAWGLMGHEMVRFDHWYAKHRGIKIPNE